MLKMGKQFNGNFTKEHREMTNKTNDYIWTLLASEK
jgi:hypothetical protein